MTTGKSCIFTCDVLYFVSSCAWFGNTNEINEQRGDCVRIAQRSGRESLREEK